MMRRSCIEILLVDKQNYLKYIPLIRIFTGESISEIKKKIMDEIPIITFNYPVMKSFEFNNFFLTVKKIVDAGATIEIKHYTPMRMEDISMEELKNLVIRDEEIEKEIEEERENEAIDGD